MTDQQPPSSVIEIVPSFFVLAFVFHFFKPRYTINGGPEVKGTWGTNAVGVAPGRYQVEVWLPYLFYRHLGRNGVVVDVPPSAVVRVRWRTPFVAFSKGKITVEGPMGLQG